MDTRARWSSVKRSTIKISWNLKSSSRTSLANCFDEKVYKLEQACYMRTLIWRESLRGLGSVFVWFVEASFRLYRLQHHASSIEEIRSIGGSLTIIRTLYQNPTFFASGLHRDREGESRFRYQAAYVMVLTVIFENMDWSLLGRMDRALEGAVGKARQQKRSRVYRSFWTGAHTPQHPQYYGAQVGSNNTGELTVIFGGSLRRRGALGHRHGKMESQVPQNLATTSKPVSFLPESLGESTLRDGRKRKSGQTGRHTQKKEVIIKVLTLPDVVRQKRKVREL